MKHFRFKPFCRGDGLLNEEDSFLFYSTDPNPVPKVLMGMREGNSPGTRPGAGASPLDKVPRPGCRPARSRPCPHSLRPHQANPPASPERTHRFL